MKRFFGRDEDGPEPPVEADTDDATVGAAASTAKDPGEEVVAAAGRPGEETSPGLDPPAIFPDESDAPSPGSDKWNLVLAPSVRTTPRPAAPEPDPPRPPAGQGPAALAARLDILHSMMRSFRDTMADQLTDYGRSLLRLADANQTTSRKVDKLQGDFVRLSSVLSTLSTELGAVMAQLAEADLPGAVRALGSGVEDRALAADTRAAEMHAMVEALATRLDGIELSVSGMTDELIQLRRRIPVARRPVDSAQPKPDPRPRRRR